MRCGRPPAPGDATRTEWIAFALRTLFRREAAAGVHDIYELRMPGATFRLRVEDGSLEIGGDSRPGPDAALIGDMTTVMLALMGQVPAKEAARGGRIEIEGEPQALERLLEMFRLEETAAAGG